MSGAPVVPSTLIPIRKIVWGLKVKTSCGLVTRVADAVPAVSCLSLFPFIQGAVLPLSLSPRHATHYRLTAVQDSLTIKYLVQLVVPCQLF